MRAAVLKAFPGYTADLEGRVPYMYLDVEGYVTTAEGLKIDPLPLAQRLPWIYPSSGGFVNEADIAIQWERVKAATSLERNGGEAFERLTQIRLTDASIDKLSQAKLLEMEGVLKTRFKAWDTLCADAQFGVVSLSWACGPDFVFPRFAADLIIEDFAEYASAETVARYEAQSLPPVKIGDLIGGCAFECIMDVMGNPGLIRRNAAQQQMFEAAQRVKDQGLDPDVLHYLE